MIEGALIMFGGILAGSFAVFMGHAVAAFFGRRK